MYQLWSAGTDWTGRLLACGLPWDSVSFGLLVYAIRALFSEVAAACTATLTLVWCLDDVPNQSRCGSVWMAILSWTAKSTDVYILMLRFPTGGKRFSVLQWTPGMRFLTRPLSTVLTGASGPLGHEVWL